MKVSKKYYRCTVCKHATDAEQLKKGLSGMPGMSGIVITPEAIPCPMCGTLTQEWCEEGYEPDPEIDHEYTCEVVCPHCGDSSLPDDPDMINGETIICDACDMQYDVETYYDVTYSTSKTKQPEAESACRKLPESDIETISTAKQAANYISLHVSSHNSISPWEILTWEDNYRLAYRSAAKALHPDTGGDESKFKTLQHAKKVLDKHYGIAVV